MALEAILRQAGPSSVESMVAVQYALTDDVPIKAVDFDALGEHREALKLGKALPIGSVEFSRRAMAIAGISEPENISYPEPLRPYLRRMVTLRPAGQVLGHWFIKPTTTKTFTGFVVDILGNPDHLTGYDRAQYNEFLALAPETPVWVSEPVKWLSEYRYYVIGGVVRGEGRYDDAPENMPVPDYDEVAAMAKAMSSSTGAPVAYSLDVGVLSTEIGRASCRARV